MLRRGLRQRHEGLVSLTETNVDGRHEGARDELIAHAAAVLAPRNAREYGAAVSRLNELVDEVGDDPRDRRYRFIETLSVLIEAYDKKHHDIRDVSGADAVVFLMEQHGLTQSDLPEIGSQGVVSEVLRGKRELNVRQIRALAERFKLSPAAFFAEVN